MILCVVREWPLLHLPDGISCRVPGIDSLIWPFHNLLHAGTTVPFPVESSRVQNGVGEVTFS
jgi:hypothetical protein